MPTAKEILIKLRTEASANTRFWSEILESDVVNPYSILTTLENIEANILELQGNGLTIYEDEYYQAPSMSDAPADNAAGEDYIAPTVAKTIPVRRFTTTGTELHAQIILKTPIETLNSRLRFQVDWICDSGGSGDAIFAVKAVNLRNSLTSEAWGDEVELTDTRVADDYAHSSGVSDAVTIGGNAVVGKSLVMVDISVKNSAIGADVLLVGAHFFVEKTYTPTTNID